MTLVNLASELNGKELPRGVYESAGLYYCWESGKPGAPLLPTHILWHIDYSDGAALKGEVRFLDFSGNMDLGFGGGIVPAVPGRSLEIIIEYTPGADQGPHSAMVETDSDAAAEASVPVTAYNEKEVSFEDPVLTFSDSEPEKPNTVKSLYKKAVLSAPKGTFTGDPVFSLTPVTRRRVQKALAAESGTLYYVDASGLISDNINTALSRAALGLPSGEWMTFNRNVYVNIDLTTGANDGTSPQDAYRGVGCCAAAVSDAASKSLLLREPVQILMAGGTYPQENLWGIRYKMRVYGGFDSDFTVRDLVNTPTVIDGEGTSWGAQGITESGIVDGLQVINTTASTIITLAQNSMLKNCRITGNTGSSDIVDFRGGTVLNCYFEGNIAASKYFDCSSASYSGRIINSISVGGFINLQDTRSDFQVINSTFVDDGLNPGTPWIYAGTVNYGSNIRLINSIFWGTDTSKVNFGFFTSTFSPSEFPFRMLGLSMRGGVSGGNIWNSAVFYDKGDLVVINESGTWRSYACIQAGFNKIPASNPAYWLLIDDSEIVNTADPELDTDYTPRATSPCIDAGDVTPYTDSDSPAYGITLDYYDNPRYKVDGGGVPVNVDIGAVQRQT